MLGCLFFEQNDRIKSSPQATPAAVEAGDQSRRPSQYKRPYQNWDAYFGYYSKLRMD
jgi:hypothetical protein